MRSIMLGLLAFLPSVATAQFTDWTEPIEPFRIADDLYYVGTAGLAAYLFTSDDGHVLIDAPLQENVPLVLANIRVLGFDPADVRVQLASHAHFDHVGGLAAMIAATGADLVLSEADAPFVRDGIDFGLETNGYPAAAPTRTIEHLESVRLGDLSLTAHVTPGHTRGCTSWSGSVEIGGEALTFVSICSLTVLPMYRIVEPAPTYPGQAHDFCQSVAHLRTLDPDIFLASHGSFFGMEEKVADLREGNARAFVERIRYRAYLDRAQEGIERALSEQGHSGGCASVLRESATADEVRAREIAFAQTLADRDFDAFLTFISPEAIFFNGNEPLRGREEIARGWAPFFEGPVAPFSWGPDLVELLESGGLALSSGPVTAATGEVAGRFNSIWRRDPDGQWRVVFDKGS